MVGFMEVKWVATKKQGNDPISWDVYAPEKDTIRGTWRVVVIVLG